MSVKSNNNDFLSFEIDKELFGINLNSLNQIIESPELTKVPKASDLLEGIIYHNNKLLPIVNLQNWLNIENHGIGERNNVLVIELHSEEGVIDAGLKVDKVLEVVHFEDEEIEKVPEVGNGNTKYIRGVSRYLDKFIMLIDVEELFTEKELETIKQSRDVKAEDTLEEIALGDSFVNTYLTFTLGKEKLAVDANKVVEILDVPNITPVPGSEAHLAGIVNIRGSILPVVDTRLKFNIDITEENEKITTVMVLDVLVNGDEISVGAIVDSVTDIIEIDEEKINETVSLDLPFNPEYLKGVANVNNHFIQLMNIDKVFELKAIEK
ncbi:MAG: purine-binding chemotaxis protein CheW [Cyclobacteriaceae bacterium]|nr:purine-binding chemotaxis protein CheW [Cyclobacteriaceae bacterium]